MSLQHFYLATQALAAEQDETFLLDLAPGDLKHARVLRLSAGERIAVVDAACDYFECEVASLGSEGLSVRIASRLKASERPRVTLVQGIAKGDKMDDIVRHATELGIVGFVPMACERSVVKLDAKKARSRAERWASIAKSAAMQAGLTRVPEVSEPSDAAGAAALAAQASAVLVFWEEAPLEARIAPALAETMQAAGCEDPRRFDVVVVVGPEGGLTAREVDRFVKANERTRVVTLGPSILRTETAGVVAPALVLYELEGRA